MDSVEVRSFIFMLKLFTLLLIAIFLAVFVGCIWFLVSIIYSFFSYERQVHVPVSKERRPVSVSISVSNSRVVKPLVSLVNRLRCAFKANYERQLQVPVSNGLFSPEKLRKLQDDYNRTCRENDCDLERGERRPVSVSKSRVVKSLVSLVNRLRCAFKAGIHAFAENFRASKSF